MDLEGDWAVVLRKGTVTFFWLASGGDETEFISPLFWLFFNLSLVRLSLFGFVTKLFLCLDKIPCCFPVKHFYGMPTLLSIDTPNQINMSWTHMNLTRSISI